MPLATLTIVTEVISEHDIAASLRELQGGARENGAPFSLVRGLHFARFAIVKGYAEHDLAPALVFALVYEGKASDFIERVVAQARPMLDQIYIHCKGYDVSQDAQAVAKYLARHDQKVALSYQGTEDLDLETIRAMQEVRRTLRDNIDEAMRQGGAADSTFRLASEAHQVYQRMSGIAQRLALPENPRKSARVIKARTGAWVVLLVAVAALLSAMPVLAVWGLDQYLEAHWHWWSYVWLGLLPLGLPTAELCRREWAKKNRPSKLDDTNRSKVVEEEDLTPQNALTHCAIVNGRFRRIVLHAVFWVIRLRVTLVDSLAGSLGGITSIHFGRWVLIDRGRSARRLVFMSDYDGSWESYLGEFVDRASKGLSAVWSNTDDFPYTRLLVFDGARDEQKFKEWTRANQVKTLVWYGAYPQQTLRNIENDLRVVRGVSVEPAPPAPPTWLASL